MPDATLEGGCLCGAVRYQALGASRHPTLCHCESCRRAAGAPLVAWVSVSDTDFAFVRGRPTRFRSSPRVERSFCGVCGTPLTYVHADFPEDVDVTTCSLDDPGGFPPADHTWISQRIAWMTLDDRLPRFERARHEEEA